MICTSCNLPKEPTELAKRGDKYRSYCKSCDSKRERSTEYKARQQKGKSAQRSRHRKRDRAWAIYINSKDTDNRAGRKWDITLSFVRNLIKDGCLYCGETEIQMTLDRIDNALGHLQSNVNSSCIRCNYIRRDMPYDAWIEIVPAIKIAKTSGLFGSWIGGWLKGSTRKVK